MDEKLNFHGIKFIHEITVAKFQPEKHDYYQYKRIFHERNGPNLPVLKKGNSQ
jgi:hypothetical protein